MLEDTNPDAAGMYVVRNVHTEHEDRKEIQEGSPTINFLVGNDGLRTAERWEDMPSMSSEHVLRSGRDLRMFIHPSIRSS